MPGQIWAFFFSELPCWPTASNLQKKCMQIAGRPAALSYVYTPNNEIGGRAGGHVAKHIAGSVRPTNQKNFMKKWLGWPDRRSYFHTALVATYVSVQMHFFNLYDIWEEHWAINLPLKLPIHTFFPKKIKKCICSYSYNYCTKTLWNRFMNSGQDGQARKSLVSKSIAITRIHSAS